MTGGDATGSDTVRGDATGSDTATGTDPAEPSLLEFRYRRMLRVLPRPYRAARGDEMTEVFLTDARERDPENWDLTQKFGSPGRAEWAATVALALRLRWADPASPARYRVRLDAVRLAVLAFLLLASVDVATSIANRISLELWPPEWWDSGGFPAFEADVALSTRVWMFISNWVSVAWPVALALALAARPHRRQLTWWAAAAAALPMVVGIVRGAQQPDLLATWWVHTAVDLLAVLGLVTVAAAGQSVRIPSYRSWLGTTITVAAGLVILGEIAYWVANWTATLPADAETAPLALVIVGWVVVDQTGLWCVATVVAAVILLLRTRRGTVVTTAAMLGLAYFAGAVGVLRLVDAWPFYSTWSNTIDPNWITIGAVVVVTVQCVAIVVVAVIAGIRAAIRVRALPPVTYRA